MRYHVIVLSVVLMVMISLCPAQAQSVLDNPKGSSGSSDGVLSNPQGALDRPVRLTLYYNNQSQYGDFFWVNGQPFISINAVKTLFNINDMYDTDKGSYMVNGRGVDKYYYNNRLYISLGDFCGATGMTCRPINNNTGLVFLTPSKPPDTHESAANAPVTVVINSMTKGTNPDPVDNCSYIYNVSLTNTTGQLITLNHFSFIILGSSGARYVSVKDMTYQVVYGGNDTPDALLLDQGRSHRLNLTFDLPDSDTPVQFIVLSGQTVLGRAPVKND